MKNKKLDLRIEEELKNDFLKYCKENKLVPSKLIRKFIEDLMYKRD